MPKRRTPNTVEQTYSGIDLGPSYWIHVRGTPQENIAAIERGLADGKRFIELVRHDGEQIFIDGTMVSIVGQVDLTPAPTGPPPPEGP